MSVYEHKNLDYTSIIETSNIHQNSLNRAQHQTSGRPTMPRAVDRGAATVTDNNKLLITLRATSGRRGDKDIAPPIYASRYRSFHTVHTV